MKYTVSVGDLTVKVQLLQNLHNVCLLVCVCATMYACMHVDMHACMHAYSVDIHACLHDIHACLRAFLLIYAKKLCMNTYA